MSLSNIWSILFSVSRLSFQYHFFNLCFSDFHLPYLYELGIMGITKIIVGCRFIYIYIYVFYFMLLSSSYRKQEPVAIVHGLHDDVSHQMETFSALLAICAGNSPVTVNSSHKGQRHGALKFSLIWAWINGSVNNREAGDWRRHRAHYDVTVMLESGHGVVWYTLFWWLLMEPTFLSRANVITIGVSSPVISSPTTVADNTLLLGKWGENRCVFLCITKKALDPVLKK